MRERIQNVADGLALILVAWLILNECGASVKELAGDRENLCGRLPQGIIKLWFNAEEQGGTVQMADLGWKTWFLTTVKALLRPSALLCRIQGCIEKGPGEPFRTAITCHEVAIRSKGCQWLPAIGHMARGINGEASLMYATPHHTKRETRAGLTLPVVIGEQFAWSFVQEMAWAHIRQHRDQSSVVIRKVGTNNEHIYFVQNCNAF